MVLQEIISKVQPDVIIETGGPWWECCILCINAAVVKKCIVIGVDITYKK